MKGAENNHLKGTIISNRLRLPSLLSNDCLLGHDFVEIIRIYEAIAVGISMLDHLEQLSVRHALPYLSTHPFEVLERDVARIIIIEEVENFVDILFAVGTGSQIPLHGTQKFVKAESTISV